MPEDRNGTIADSTSADSTLPISFLALQAEAFGTGAGSQNDGVRGLRLFTFLSLAPIPERTSREVNLRHRLGDNLGAESYRLFTEFVHQLWAQNACRESGKVFDCKR